MKYTVVDPTGNWDFTGVEAVNARGAAMIWERCQWTWRLCQESEAEDHLTVIGGEVRHLVPIRKMAR